MSKLTDEEIVAIVDAEFQQSMGKEGGEISAERAKAWKYYMSKPLGNEIEGSSQIVTSDVADVVDGLMPSLLRLFTTADNLVSFDPVNMEDEEAAEQESDYVNYVFFKQNPAFLILYTWFFDALVQKNGIVKAWWDDSELITTESYTGLSQNELFELLADEELEPVERSERVAETIDEMGQIVQATVHDIEFRRVSKKGQARVENVPPEEYRISADARSLDPCGARMVGHERDVTRSELIDMGFDKDLVESLASDGALFYSSEEKIARKDKEDEQSDNPHGESEQKIRYREAYIRLDTNKDGRSELRQVITAGNVLLSNEPADRQPFHVISPQPLPHKHFGRASSEKVMDIQQVNTTLLRQTLDNLYHSNNPSHAVWEGGMGENTLDDLLLTRVGKVARFSRPVNESYQTISLPFTAGSSFDMMAYFEKAKRDRTGISSDSEGLSPEALKNIQTTVMAQASDLGRMKIEAVARIFAETGIKSLFLHIHELLLKHQQKAQIVKLRNTWTEVNPQEWRTRLDMTVNIGLGIGTREQNLMHLNAIWEKQRDLMMNGGMGTLVRPMNLYNTAAQIVKNANLKQPEMFFTATDEMTPPDDPSLQMQQQQMQLAAKQQELEAQRQALNAAKHQLEQEKAMAQHQREMEKISLQNQEREDKLFIAIEEISNALTKMELDAGRNIPGSRV
jgi:hypothetical protein